MSEQAIRSTKEELEREQLEADAYERGYDDGFSTGIIASCLAGYVSGTLRFPIDPLALTTRVSPMNIENGVRVIQEHLEKRVVMNSHPESVNSGGSTEQKRESLVSRIDEIIKLADTGKSGGF